ncbi:outer membrane lipoprotein LolB, partial [Pseudomonas gingeri]
MFLRHLVVFSLIALLAGCAGFGARESVEGHGDPAQWAKHKQQLSSLDGWQINGKVGIRAPKDSGSGTLYWLQRQDYYDIRLSGPLGRGAARLTGRPGQVSLEVANQGRYEAAT